MLFRTLRRLLLMIFLLAASAGVQARTVTDIDGNRVAVPDAPQRIVLGESRMLYTLAMLEPGDPFRRIIGWPLDLKKYDSQTWNIFARQFPDMLKIAPLGLGGISDINPEQVIALKPDLVILPSLARTDDANRQLETMLKAAHIPVVRIDLRVQLLKNTTRSVQILGEVLNQTARAQRFNQFYDAHMQVIRDRLANFHGHRPTALLQLHLGRRNECCVTAVKGSLGELLAFAGGDNIASGSVQGVFGRLSEETVIMAQPDNYFATGTGDESEPDALQLGPTIAPATALNSLRALTAKQQGLRELPVIRSGHASALWHNFYLSPWHVAAAEFFARTLYPQLFSDLDPDNTMRQLFREFLPVAYTGTYFIRDQQ